MRLLVWLLLLVNVAILGYFQLVARSPAGPGAGHEPIQPEKIHLLTPEQLAAMPKRVIKPGSMPVPGIPLNACYEWGSFAPDALVNAQAVLKRLAVENSVRQNSTAEAARYWIYIPPRRTMEEAQAKGDQLRALGVLDFFVVQEPNWRFAISLGVFEDEKLANNLLQELRARGVRSAVKGLRNNEGTHASLLLKWVAPDVVMQIRQLKPDFPGSDIKQANCE